MPQVEPNTAFLEEGRLGARQSAGRAIASSAEAVPVYAPTLPSLTRQQRVSEEGDIPTPEHRSEFGCPSRRAKTGPL